MTARVSMLLKSRASLTCFRACFFLVGLGIYQHPGKAGVKSTINLRKINNYVITFESEKLTKHKFGK